MSAAQKICPQCGTEYPANARFCEIDGTALRSGAGAEDLVGSIVADRYHVMKKLGEGGMGQVYLVEHVKMGRKSALKVMHPGMGKDVDAISRFNREAANASRISHPNVASVYDFGETADGIIYLAMEFVDGPPLTAVIEQNGALPPKRAAEIVRQTAEALAVAHDMGIVHRDLKPDNIMIGRTRDDADLVKVVDFGIAKAAGNEAQKVTKTGLVVGTPEYMSPEQLAGDKLDGRSDIYSLALVAFNMLTGSLPFPSDSAQESMIMRLTDRPKALRDMRPDVAWPVEVQDVMDKALERDANIRYKNATEFGRDLVRAIDRMPDARLMQSGAQSGAQSGTQSGTQAIGAPAVPPTRIPAGTPATVASMAPGTPGSIKTVSMTSPSTPVSPGALPPSGTPLSPGAPPRTKSPMMLVAGGVVVLAVAGGAWFVMHSKSAAADTGTGKLDSSVVSPSLGNSGTANAPGNPSANPPANMAANTAANTAARGTTANPAPTSAPVQTNAVGSAANGANGMKASDPVEQLRALITDSRNPAKAANVLKLVNQLEPQAVSSEGIYLAARLRSNVAATAGDTATACKELDKVISKVAEAEKESIATRKGEGALQCP